MLPLSVQKECNFFLSGNHTLEMTHQACLEVFWLYQPYLSSPKTIPDLPRTTKQFQVQLKGGEVAEVHLDREEVVEVQQLEAGEGIELQLKGGEVHVVEVHLDGEEVVEVQQLEAGEGIELQLKGGEVHVVEVHLDGEEVVEVQQLEAGEGIELQLKGEEVQLLKKGEVIELHFFLQLLKGEEIVEL